MSAFSFTPEAEAKLGIRRMPMGSQPFGGGATMGATDVLANGRVERVVVMFIGEHDLLEEYLTSGTWYETTEALACLTDEVWVLDDSIVMPLTDEEKELINVVIRERTLYADCFGI